MSLPLVIKNFGEFGELQHLASFFNNFHYTHNIPYAKRLQFTKAFPPNLIPTVLIHQTFYPPSFMYSSYVHELIGAVVANHTETICVINCIFSIIEILLENQFKRCYTLIEHSYILLQQSSCSDCLT